MGARRNFCKRACPKSPSYGEKSSPIFLRGGWASVYSCPPSPIRESMPWLAQIVSALQIDPLALISGTMARRNFCRWGTPMKSSLPPTKKKRE